MDLDFIRSFDPREPVVIALSGGPDSMALLSLLESHFDTIICAHVNHNTGRIGQNEDEEFVKEYAMKHHLIFESFKIENYDNTNFHNQAHIKRYEFFEIILQKYHSRYLFTAHHGDDLVETMIFRMMRGTTLASLHGFSCLSKKDQYMIIRPLLKYTKQEIIEYNKKNHIPYRIDSSNDKEIYTRNRIRKTVLPFLKKEQKNVHLKFLKLSEELEELEHFVLNQSLLEKRKRFRNNELNVCDWEQLDIVIQKKVLQLVLSDIYKENQQVLSSKHIQVLQRFIMQSISGASLDFPRQIFVRKEYQTILFLKQEANICYELELHTDLKLPNGHSIKRMYEEETDSNFVCRLDSSEIQLPLFVRTKKVQDRIKVKGMNGAKKVKEIFINSKVPIHLRKSWPIVVDNTGKIIWIPGIKKSQFDKTKDQKYDIILKYY